MFKLIACVNNKNYIGKNNKLLYHIKNDMGNFKRITTDNVVIMGRNTFESLPKKKPLPNRINIIITSNKGFHIGKSDNAYIVSSIHEAIELCETLFVDKDWYVIGGALIYKQFIEANLIDTMYLTRVYDDTIGDAYVPEIGTLAHSWKTLYSSDKMIDKDTNVEYRFETLKK